MLTTKKLMFLLLVIFLAMPVKVCIPQQADNEVSQADDSDSNIIGRKRFSKLMRNFLLTWELM